MRIPWPRPDALNIHESHSDAGKGLDIGALTEDVDGAANDRDKHTDSPIHIIHAVYR